MISLSDHVITLLSHVKNSSSHAIKVSNHVTDLSDPTIKRFYPPKILSSLEEKKIDKIEIRHR